MQEVSVRHLGNDAGLHARRPQCFKKSVVTPEFFVLAVPVAPQLVTFGRIHGGDEFERIERFAAGIYLLEDDANGFLRCSGSQGNHGHVVAFETLKYLPFEAPEFSPHWFVFRTTPVAVESVLPIIPIEDAGQGINQRFEFVLLRRQIKNHLAPEASRGLLVFRYGNYRFIAINGRIESLSYIDVEPAFHFLLLGRDRFDDLAAYCDLIER